MKTLHLAVIAILFAFGITSESYGQMVKDDLTDGNTFSMNAKDRGLPSDIVEIDGNLMTKDAIKITLNDPDGIIRDSATTFADRNGDFTSELKIPSDATAGTWKIIGNSGLYHRELNFTVIGNSVSSQTCYGCGLLQSNSTGITASHPLIHGTNSTNLQSPLEQFKSGIKPEYVKCSSNLHLIIKAEDGSFACVTIETAKILVLREWAVTFSTGISTSDYYTKCDTLYPQSDTGVAVLYMPTNIIGKICVQYHNVNNTPTTVGMRIFEANNMTRNAADVTAWTYDSTLEANANKTIVYFIKTGNRTGFYGASLNCGGIPLAVGYDNHSAITANDFPWVGQVFHCGVITYDSHIEGTTGIGVKYIPYP